jgi:hypothetical protein
MHDVIEWWFWLGGALKVIGETSQVTRPLILKVGNLYGLWFASPLTSSLVFQLLIKFMTMLIIKRLPRHTRRR